LSLLKRTKQEGEKVARQGCETRDDAETEIVVRADGKADNGLLYGARVDLDPKAGADPTALFSPEKPGTYFVIDDDPLALTGIGPRSEGGFAMTAGPFAVGLIAPDQEPPSILDPLALTTTDDLKGNAGNDTLVLPDGESLLVCGSGNDYLLLGPGARGDDGAAGERFVFTINDPQALRLIDRVVDLSAASDEVQDNTVEETLSAQDCLWWGFS
jgi:hypothetical protein